MYDFVYNFSELTSVPLVAKGERLSVIDRRVLWPTCLRIG